MSSTLWTKHCPWLLTLRWRVVHLALFFSLSALSNEECFCWSTEIYDFMMCGRVHIHARNAQCGEGGERGGLHAVHHVHPPEPRVCWWPHLRDSGQARRSLLHLLHPRPLRRRHEDQGPRQSPQGLINTTFCMLTEFSGRSSMPESMYLRNVCLKCRRRRSKQGRRRRQVRYSIW